MAVKNQGNLNNTPNLFTGLSTDTKPTSVPLKSEFSETDTGDWYRFNGSSWKKFASPSSDGSDGYTVFAEVTNTIYPSQNYVQIDGTAQAVVTDNIYLSGDVSMYNVAEIEAITAAAKVEASLDGINFFPVSVTLSSTLLVAATIAAGDMGIVEGKYAAIRVRPNAAVSTNARVSHGVK